MERDEMPCDVLFVGGGPACLAGAIHLKNLIDAHNAAVESGGKQGEALEEPMICLIEKGSELGAHQMSGAVMDPRALDELIPDWRERDDFPIERWVETEEMALLTPEGSIPAPWIPPEMHNMGKPIVSLGKLCAWMGGVAEEMEINIFPGFAGAELLMEEGKVTGVRCGDRGVLKDGSHSDDYEPGMDLQCPITILGEGPRGSLTKQLIATFELDANSNPMIYELGCKEVLEMPKGTVTEGFVAHTVGYPLDLGTFGGSFLYSMGDDKVCIGILAALDAKDPELDVHHLLQLLKDHPYMREKIGEGKVIKYGAKAVTIGGWGSMPQLYTEGAMIVGDSGSFLNPMRIKGIHLSMKSGMLAAEAAFEAMISGDHSAAGLKSYKEKLDASWVREEMEPAKNMHANFAGGLVGGLVRTGVQYFLGAGPQATYEADYKHIAKVADYTPKPWTRKKLDYDGTYLIDKLTDVYNSGTVHDEHQPCHLKITDTEICATKCLEEYGNPCTKFCPAQVYNMRMNEEAGRLEMEVDFGNCVHCKTCDIRDPYQIITWTPPQGGEGPEFEML